MRILLFLLIVPFLVNGQNAIIRGVAPLAIGEEIQLRVYGDPISGTERVLTSQKIDVDGSFELQVVPNGQAQYAFLQVGTDCADFFIQRDKEIELSFVPPKLDPNKPRGFNERQFFIPKITGGSGASLNQGIVAFNDTLDGFLESIYPFLLQRKSPAIVAGKVNDFQSYAENEFKTDDTFLVQYVKFSLAEIEQTYLTDRDRLFDKYLKGTQPQFHNPAYTDFVLQFFQESVYKLAVVEQHDKCKVLFGENDAFAQLDQLLLESEPKLTDVALRRLVLIDGIEGLFGQKDFKDEDLIRALNSFAMVSSNFYLGSAARNVAAKHATLAKGTVAPDIIYTDLNGVESKLSDHFGEYIFLELTDATNDYSNRETNVIPMLKSEFGSVKFVTICVGNSEVEISTLQKKMNIDWELGSIEMSSKALDDYRIKSLPLFFIIDPDGKFYAAPAKDPSKGAQMELSALQEQLKKKHKFRVGK